MGARYIVEPLATLDCGHPESLHGPHTTGYGTTADGRKHCYECCRAADVAAAQSTGVLYGYLSSDGRTVTTWPGLPLAAVMAEWETSAGGFARRTTITRVQARMDDGSRWHGSGPGRGMYIKLRRAKSV